MTDEIRSLPEHSASHRDPWTTAKDFRALPCSNVNRAWVEVNCPDRIVEMSAAEARKLAAHLNSVATIVECWS